jgi:DNA-binding HxlR family transcriptional regulator
VAGALQLIGDKWTMLVVRDLVAGPKRTTELLAALHPISSRTLVGRLRDMEQDELIERHDFGGSPPHVEYTLTGRGRLLLPFLDALRHLGQSLDCNECEDRRERLGDYCDACPHRSDGQSSRTPARRRQRDDSIVLL